MTLAWKIFQHQRVTRPVVRRGKEEAGDRRCCDLYGENTTERFAELKTSWNQHKIHKHTQKRSWKLWKKIHTQLDGLGFEKSATRQVNHSHSWSRPPPVASQPSLLLMSSALELQAHQVGEPLGTVGRISWPQMTSKSLGPFVSSPIRGLAYPLRASSCGESVGQIFATSKSPKLDGFPWGFSAARLILLESFGKHRERQWTGRPLHG